MKSSLYRLSFLLTAAFFLTFVTPEVTLSQDVASGLTADSGLSEATNDYGRPGYPRVRVYLWGNANNGVWTVEEGTDLLEFLSAAATGNFNRSSDTRNKNVLKVYRRGQVGEKPAFEMDIREIFARQDVYPQLQNGDVLVVESVQRRRFFSFRNVSQVTGTLASVASLVFLIDRF